MEIKQSSYKRRVTKEKILHAISNPFIHYDLDEIEMCIGAALNGIPIEVGIIRGDTVIHAMKARSKLFKRKK